MIAKKKQLSAKEKMFGSGACTASTALVCMSDHMSMIRDRHVGDSAAWSIPGERVISSVVLFIGVGGVGKGRDTADESNHLNYTI